MLWVLIMPVLSWAAVGEDDRCAMPLALHVFACHVDEITAFEKDAINAYLRHLPVLGESVAVVDCPAVRGR